MTAARAYWLLLLWQWHRFKRFMVMIVVIQVALAFGMVYGLAFLIPNIDARTALYLATGAPTITLLVMGLTIVPQEVSQGKLTGRFDYLASLPIPRLATLASDVTFWLLAQLPGTALALVVASLRFDFSLRISLGHRPDGPARRVQRGVRGVRARDGACPAGRAAAHVVHLDRPVALLARELPYRAASRSDAGDPPRAPGEVHGRPDAVRTHGLERRAPRGRLRDRRGVVRGRSCRELPGGDANPLSGASVLRKETRPPRVSVGGRTGTNPSEGI